MEAVLTLSEQELKDTVAPVVATAKGLAIKDNSSHAIAAEMLLDVKAAIKKVHDAFDEGIEDAHTTWMNLIKKRASYEDPLKQAEGILKLGMSKYETEQERVQKQQELELQRLAQKQEEERRMREAVALENIGEHKEAEAVINERPVFQPVVLAPAVPKISGIVSKTVWKFRITDINKIPHKYLIAEMQENHDKNRPDPRLSPIRNAVRDLKDLHGIPGIEAYPEKSISAGRK